MKLSPVFSTVLVTAISATTALGFSSQAKALVFSGDSNGIWGKPEAGTINTRAMFTGVGTDTFTWGLPILKDPRFGTPPNSLIFKGTSFQSELNSLFKIGDLTYYNGTVPQTTNVEKVPLKLELLFKQPGVINETFEYDFDLTNTVNDLNKPFDSIDNADIVTIRQGLTNRSFIYQGKKYTLELTGFSQDDGLTSTNKFQVRESKATKAAIYGRITYVAPAEKVPEPGILAGLSVVGVYIIARKQRSQTKDL